MANPLTKIIMNNISKKTLNKECSLPKNNKYSTVNNINKEEEEILKNILNKNNSKINLISLKNSNINKYSNKSNINSKKQIPKDKINKNMISLKDLAK